MQAHQLKPAEGATHARKRIGRGNASGPRHVLGQGIKGQKARAGASRRQASRVARCR